MPPTKTSPIVELRPMTTADFAAWLPASRLNYAADKVRSGNWPEAGAAARAARETAALLPEGVATAGHLFYLVIDKRLQQPVGTVWLNVKDSGTPKQAFLYNIEVSPESRGLGYGTATFAAIEAELRRREIPRLALHVFGFNAAAQRLYSRLGFAVTNVNMAKEL